MTETLRWSKIFVEDIAFGSGTQEIELIDSVESLTEINISHVARVSNNEVVYASSDGSTDSVFTYDPSNDRLAVPEIKGGAAASDTLTLMGTTHATPGDIILNSSGGNIGVGTSSPDNIMHVSGANPAIEIDATSGDPAVVFSLSTTDTWHLGIDNSNDDKLMIGTGGSLGTGTVITFRNDGDIGIGTESPSALLHVQNGTATGITVPADADEFLVENSGDAGITIASGATDNSYLRLSRALSTTAGYLRYDHTNDAFRIGVNSSDRVIFPSGGGMLLGTATANSYGTNALTISQSTSDDHILTLRSSDVAHGVTDLADTTAFGYSSKMVAANGGLLIAGLTENIIGLGIDGVIAVEDTTTADNSSAAIMARARGKSGTGTTALGATANIFGIQNEGTTAFLVKGDGDVHNSGGSTSMGVYDDHDDVRLLQTVKAVMDPEYKERLGGWVNEHQQTLERGGIITNTENGFFISQRGWRGLLIDAITQLGQRITHLESERK